MSRKEAAKLFESLTDIREDFLEEAQEKPEKQKAAVPWGRWAAAAACVCLLAGAALFLRDRLWFPAPQSTENAMAGGAAPETAEPGMAESSAAGVTGEAGGSEARRWPVKIIELPSDGDAEQMASFGIPWEDREIYNQYAALIFDGRLYHANGPDAVPAEKLAGEPQKITAFSDEGGQTPEDINYTPERQTAAVVSRIQGVSAECAVAVRYEGTQEWYPALNYNYTPQTLGRFIEDLNLRENLALGTVTYGYWPDGEYAEVHFDSVDSGKIRELLLSHTEAENVCRDLESGEFHTLFDPEVGEPAAILEISAGVPLLGEKNLTLQVREDGYLWTNLMGMTEKAFLIGEENTQAFVDYVLNQCEGYEVQYVFPEQPHDEGERDDSSTVSYIATPEGLIPADRFGSEGRADASASSAAAAE